MKRFLFPLILLISSSAQAQRPVEEWLRFAQEKRLASHPAWLALLHYHRDILGRWRSSVDDPSFFLSRSGHRRPAAELEATLRAFAENRLIKDAMGNEEPAACRYPARFTWLNDQLSLEDAAAPVCDRFVAWKEKLAPTDVSLIFASYYLNNPASMYGHTFLKLSRHGYEAGQGLLDYTINFAAQTDTRNGVMFAVKGLMGGYPGRFSTEPYYMKIQQYTNMESRDLWEYRLNINPEVRDQLVRHLWELGPVSMKYFFFNKNCSYQLLPLLEAAEPSWSASRQFKFRAIPLDTLKAVVNQPGVLKDRRLRPSHVRTMLARRSRLDLEEIELAEIFADGVQEHEVVLVNRLPPARRAAVLDSAYDLLRYRAGFHRNQNESVQAAERSILTLRKEISPEEAALPALTFDERAPEEGHGTLRVGVAVGADKEEGFEELSVRAAVHDLEADPTGFVEGSQLEMFHLRGRYRNGSGQAYLEELALIRIFSLSPRDRWVKPPSWAVEAGIFTAHDLPEEPQDSLVGGVRGGSGVTLALPALRNSLVYAMWTGDAQVGPRFDDEYRLGAGGTIGILSPWARRFRLHLRASALRYPVGHVGNVVRLSAIQNVALDKNTELRLSAKRENGHSEAMLSLNRYW